MSALDGSGKTLTLGNHRLELPIFLPDATFGVVRGTDAADLERAGVSALMMNVFHLMQKPGSSTIQALGGIHQMANWPRPIFTDSGGFQAYSLIRQNAKFGTLNKRGISFYPEGSKRKFQLTPEKSVQLQLAYGTDVVYCLDDCTHVDDPLEQQELSVSRTIDWAERCKAEFERQMATRDMAEVGRPRLFAIVQGGGEQSLRQQCAEALLALGFDGYGFGGWPLDSQNQLLTDMLAYVRALIPAELPLHALGVGQPGNILTCYQLGYAIFDSAMPTRDARHGRLCIFNADPADTSFSLRGDWYSYLYMKDRKHIKVKEPLSLWCDCYTCQHYSLGYLHHLFKSNDTLYYRLATIHNLCFMMQLVQSLSTTSNQS
jgi:queuine tRNA-ribosyltransferase